MLLLLCERKASLCSSSSSSSLLLSSPACLPVQESLNLIPSAPHILQVREKVLENRQRRRPPQAALIVIILSPLLLLLCALRAGTCVKSPGLFPMDALVPVLFSFLAITSLNRKGESWSNNKHSPPLPVPHPLYPRPARPAGNTPATAPLSALAMRERFADGPRAYLGCYFKDCA